jgi:STE24 endopeptidase
MATAGVADSQRRGRVAGAYDSQVDRLRSWGDRKRGVMLVGIGLAFTAAAVLLLRWRLWSSGVPSPVEGDLTGVFDPGELAADRNYRRGLQIMAWVGLPVAPAVAVAVAWTSSRWRGRLARLVRGRVVAAGAVLGAGLALATALAGLPLGVLRYAWIRDHGVCRQPTGSWLVDRLEGTVIQMVILAVAVAVVAAAVHYLRRTWWLALGGLVAVLVVGITLLSPVVIAPRFEQTAALDDPALERDIRALADRAEVRVDEIVVSDASRRTRTLNARVDGLGATQRVVLFDTLLAEAPPAELRWVVAHELAHAKEAHVAKGVAWVAALALPLALVVFGATGAIAGFGRGGRQPDVEATLARTAVALAVITVLMAVSAPLVHAVSRAYEREADWIALQLTADPQAAIDFRVRTRELRRGDVDPPVLTQLWFGTHPTPQERVGMAQHFAALHGS